MNKTLKYVLIGAGAVTVATVGFLVIRKQIRKRNEKRNEEKVAKGMAEELTQIQDDLNYGSSSSTSVATKSRIIEPKRNINRELSNPLSEIKGMLIYPAQKSSNADLGHDKAIGYVNVRTSAEVNNSGSHWSGLDSGNLVGKISGDSPIGWIMEDKLDNMTPKQRWFKVKLYKTMEDCSGYGLMGSQCTDINTGWVRADNVTFRTVSADKIMQDACKGKGVLGSAFKYLPKAERDKKCKNYGGFSSVQGKNELIPSNGIEYEF